MSITSFSRPLRLRNVYLLTKIILKEANSLYPKWYSSYVCKIITFSGLLSRLLVSCMSTCSPAQGGLGAYICLHATFTFAVLSTCSMELINEWLWRQEYWLPPGITWKDLEQMKGSPFPRDLLISLPLALGFISLRKAFER